MKKTIIFSGFMGVLLMGAASADHKVATVNHVDRNVDLVNTNVVTLNTRANTDKATVDGHTLDVSSLTTGRQVVPTNEDECAGLDTRTYSGCGYISSSGTDGQYKLIKIVKAETASGSGNGGSSPTPVEVTDTVNP